jgi:hypothetical protein
MKMMIYMSQLIEALDLNIMMNLEMLELKELKLNYKLKQMKPVKMSVKKMKLLMEKDLNKMPIINLDSLKNLKKHLINKIKLNYNNKSMLLKKI